MAQPGGGRNGKYMPEIMKNYTVLNTEPVYRRTAVMLDPLVINSLGLGGSASSAIRVESQFHDRVMPWVKLSYSWIDVAALSWEEDMPIAVEGIKNQLVTEVGGAFFLLNKVYDAKVRVDVHATSSMNTTTYYYTKVSSKVRRMLGARAGNYSFRKALVINEDSRQNYSYKSADGSYQVGINEPYDPYRYPPMDPNLRQPAGTHEAPVSMTYMSSVFTGIHFRKVKNTRILLNGGRTRTSERVTDLYADVFLPYSSSVSNVMDINNTEWQLVPNPGMKNKLGWRVGGAMRYPKGHFWQGNFEVGKRPGSTLHSGLRGNGMYILVGVGFSIGFGKYELASKKKNEEATTEKSGN